MKSISPGIIRLYLLVALFAALQVVSVQAASAQVTSPRPAVFNFSIADGKTKQSLLTLKGTDSTQTAAGLHVRQEFSPARGSQPQIWKTVVTNTTPTQLQVILSWSVDWNGSALPSLSYWGGTGEPIKGAALNSIVPATANMATSMLQAVYDNQTGLALALNPLEIVSQFEQTLITTGGPPRLQLQMPIVLAGGESDSFPLEIYRFTPRYGFLDALQKYYEAHPAAFSARKNIDPAGAGVGASYTAWNGNSFERTRRFGGDWDWCYAPFRRTGDIYGRAKFWDYSPARPIPAREAALTTEQYKANRRERFAKGSAAGAAMMFYVPSFIYAEESLAKQEYPGAIVYKPNGQYAVYFDRPWVTGHDNEVLMYPWANKYSLQSQEDARQLMQENDISGFAYDTLNGGYPFRGEGMKESPRRTFDNGGEYVDLSVGVAKMMDFTRSLEQNGREMALVGNPTGNTRAFLVARCDSAMYERPPFKPVQELMPLRYALGHKALTWWDDWGIASMINWREMTPAEIRAAYLGAADYVRLISYRYGGYPSPRLVDGVPSVARELPLLKKIILQGWQAVPAVRAASGTLPPFIWPARYGQGLGSCITLGNASQEVWRGRIIVDNDYLGKSNFLFADLIGRPLRQTVQGRTTQIEVEIPSHETLVLRAVASPDAKAQGAAVVSWKDDGARGTLNIQSKLKPGAIHPPLWDKEKAQNGTFVSRYFLSPAGEILNFPFFDGAREAIVALPKTPSPEEEWAAQHIREYFEFWGKNGLSPSRAINLKIVRGTLPIEAGQPIIAIGGNGKIAREALTLRVRSTPQTSLREATLQLLNVLDKKYFYAGTFPKGGEESGEAEMIQKSGLAGKLLQENFDQTP